MEAWEDGRGYMVLPLEPSVANKQQFILTLGSFPPAGRCLIGWEPRLRANQKPVHRSFLRAPSLNVPSEHPGQTHGYDEYYININKSTHTHRAGKNIDRRLDSPWEFCTHLLFAYIFVTWEISTCCRSSCALLLFWSHVASGWGGTLPARSARLGSALPCSVSGCTVSLPSKGPVLCASASSTG